MSRSTTPSFAKIAEEVKKLHDQDEQLSRERVKNKIQQRDVRLKIGGLVKQVEDHLLPELATRTGYTVARLKDFERCATAWPTSKIPTGATYTALEELMSDPDRFDKIKGGMTKRDAREAKGGKSDTPSRWTATQTADFIKQALQNPVVAETVALDSEARSTLTRAELTAVRTRREMRETADPTRKQMRHQVGTDDAVRQINNARYAINRVLDDLMEAGITKAKPVSEALVELRTSIGWLESYLDHGDKSFEDALQALLTQED